MGQDEAEWLKRAKAFLQTKIDELNNRRTYFPEQPGGKYQTLVNPEGVSSRERADGFRADLTDDAIAEVRAAVGEPPEPFEAEMRADWFGLVCNDFQDALSANHDLANRFQNVTLVEIVSGVDTLKFGIEEILSLLKNRDAVDDNQPLAVFNLLNLEEKVYDREVERAAILEALGGAMEDDRGRFLLVTAPSGFGKSFLLTKVLQQVTDGRAIREPYRQTVSKILRVDCRATQNVGGIVGDAGSLVGKSRGPPPQLRPEPRAERANRGMAQQTSVPGFAAGGDGVAAAGKLRGVAGRRERLRRQRREPPAISQRAV